MAVEWNITRAQDEAEPLARELCAQGLRARALPCIERSTLGWPELPAGALLFLTSAAALPLPAAAQAHPVVALAKVAKLLRAEGAVVFAESDGGVVALARAFEAAWKHSGREGRARVFYLSSDLAAQQPEHAEALEVLRRFADVTAQAVYAVGAPENLSATVASLGAESGLVFFSPSAVTHFLAAHQKVRAPRPCAVVAHGASTARAYREARPEGWPDAVLHSRDVPLIETLRRFS